MQIEKCIQFINTHYGQAAACFKQGVSSLLRVGQRLIEVKDELPHGEFGAFVHNRLPFCDRMARKYMQLAKHEERVLHLLAGDKQWHELHITSIDGMLAFLGGKELAEEKTEMAASMEVQPLVHEGIADQQEVDDLVKDEPSETAVPATGEQEAASVMEADTDEAEPMEPFKTSEPEVAEPVKIVPLVGEKREEFIKSVVNDMCQRTTGSITTLAGAEGEYDEELAYIIASHLYEELGKQLVNRFDIDLPFTPGDEISEPSEDFDDWALPSSPPSALPATAASAFEPAMTVDEF